MLPPLYPFSVSAMYPQSEKPYSWIFNQFNKKRPKIKLQPLNTLLIKLPVESRQRVESAVKLLP